MRITKKQPITLAFIPTDYYKLHVCALWLPPTVHTETKSKTPPKKATGFDDTSTSALPVNIFDP